MSFEKNLREILPEAEISGGRARLPMEVFRRQLSVAVPLAGAAGPLSNVGRDMLLSTCWHFRQLSGRLECGELEAFSGYVKEFGGKACAELDAASEHLRAMFARAYDEFFHGPSEPLADMLCVPTRLDFAADGDSVRVSLDGRLCSGLPDAVPFSGLQAFRPACPAANP